MNDSLEEKVTKHSDAFYANKEILVGNITATFGGFAAAMGGSYLTESKEYLSVFCTIGNALGFQIGYILCTHKDRKNDYSSRFDFLKYIIKFTAFVNAIGGIVGHMVHTFGTDALQYANISPEWSTTIAHFPAILIGTIVSNIAGYKSGMIDWEKQK